jgi:hypothetical protein
MSLMACVVAAEPFLIRYDDGSEVTTEQFLRAELARIGSAR